MKRSLTYLTILGSLVVAVLTGSHAIAQDQQTMPPPSEARTAFAELLETIKEIDETYLSAANRIIAPDDVAEGERYLLHLLSAATEFYLEGNPDDPRPLRIVSPVRKMLGDNPDAVYYRISIAPDRDYVLRGHLSGEDYLSFTVHGSQPGSGGLTTLTGALNNKDLIVADDGSYEIIISPNLHSGNWLKSGENAAAIVTRHYFERDAPAALDAGLHIPLEVELVDALAKAPSRPNDQSIAHAFREIAADLRFNTLGTLVFDPASSPPWFSNIPNTIGKPVVWSPERDGGNVGNSDAAYGAGFFVLMPDEALIVEGRMPECDFANVMLWNRYLQTFDYANRQTSLNRKQMTINEDGTFTIAVAHQDPGQDNWLDTEGRTSGIIYWRFLLPAEEIEQIQTRVVKFNEL